MLSESSQTQMSHIVHFHLYEMSRIGRSRQTVSRVGGCQGLGGGQESRRIRDGVLPLRGVKMFSNDCANGCRTLNILERNTELCMLNEQLYGMWTIT